MGDAEAWPGFEDTEGEQLLPAHREGLCLLGAGGPRLQPQQSPASLKRECPKKKEHWLG